MRLFLGVLALGLMLAGCAGPRITMEMMEPAATGDVAALHGLAISLFRNDQGGAAKAAVENAVAAVTVGGKPYFTVYDMPSSRSAASDFYETDAYQLGMQGRSVGADGVVTGTVTRSDCAHERSTEKRYVCVERNENGYCKKLAMRPTECVRRVATFTFIPKVVDAASGRILISREFTGTADSLACAGTEDDQLASPQALLDAARASAVQDFVDRIAPHAVSVQVPLLVEDDSGMPEAVAQSVANGVEFARAGRMDRACSLWQAAAGAHRAGYALPYLCGVCAEYAGDLAGAAQQYTRADENADRPVPEIAQALARVRQAAADREKLKAQGVRP